MTFSNRLRSVLLSFARILFMSAGSILQLENSFITKSGLDKNSLRRFGSRLGLSLINLFRLSITTLLFVFNKLFTVSRESLFLSILPRAFMSTPGSFTSSWIILSPFSLSILKISSRTYCFIPSTILLTLPISNWESLPNRFYITDVFSAFYPTSFFRFFMSGIFSALNSSLSFY